MKIAVTADPVLPVPPCLYGRIERIVDMLVRGLSARGHEVTLFAHPYSRTTAELIPWPGQRFGDSIDPKFREVEAADRWELCLGMEFRR